MTYTLVIKDAAAKDIVFHKRSGHSATVSKIEILLKELQEHPYTGTGRPEHLKGNRSGQWSRRINREHRLIYAVEENIVTVIVVSAKRHYE
jgi:toxin YoeB